MAMLGRVRRLGELGRRASVQAAIYLRAGMPAGMTFAGPAIVEQDDTTTLVEPGWSGTVMENGNLLLKRD